MTTKRVVYAGADGGLRIVIPANRFIAEIESAASRLGETFTPAQLAVVACGKALTADEAGSDPLICDEADLPADRTFRGAWVRDGATPVRIDLDKAKAIAQQRVAEAAAPVLAELAAARRLAELTNDAPALAAVEAEIARVEAKKDDARLAAADTPEALKAALEAVAAEAAPKKAAAARER